MSIQSEIDRIEQNVANTYSVLAEAGAPMPASMDSDNLAGTAAGIAAVLYNKAQSLTNNQQAQGRNNINAITGSDLTLAIGADGLLYIFAKGVQVGTGIDIATAGDIIGYVDANNNVVLKGNLEDGTYSIKYELEDGSTIDIGNLVLDSNVYYTITNNLTNCVNNNSLNEILEGNSYSAVISPIQGYQIVNIKVTMGGVDITSSAVISESIEISNVTGDLVITAVAEEVIIEIINQIPISTDTDGTIYNGIGYKTGTRINSSGAAVAAPDVSATGFIPAVTGNVVYLKGMYVNDTSGYTRLAEYNSSKGVVNVNIYPTNWTNEGNDVYSYKITDSNVAFIRVGTYQIMNGSVIITINQPIQ